MNELELARWLAALAEIGLIERWQRTFGFGDTPVAYLIDGSEYTHEEAVNLVRGFEVGHAA